MIRRCRECGLCVPPEASACGYCGCAESVHEPLSPTLARKIITGALVASAAGLPITMSCGGETKYGAQVVDSCGPQSDHACTDAGDAEAEAGDDAGGEAGGSDAADAAPE